MFYEPLKRNHGLPHDPFKAIIAPRPIGWVTTMSKSGAVNLAPYSFFNGFASFPPIVGFSSEGRKDSLEFAEETKEFVCNLSTYPLRDLMNATAATMPRGVSEMEAAGIEPAACNLIKPPRVAASPCALECVYLQTVQLTDKDGKQLDTYLVLGQVVGVHINDSFIKNGLVDTAAMQPLARCGYHDYAVVNEVFSLKRPR